MPIIIKCKFIPIKVEDRVLNRNNKQNKDFNL